MPDHDKKPICLLKNVSLETEDKQRLIDVDLEVNRGDLVLIEGAGQTSPGKTSLLNVITAHEEPTEGEIFIRGMPLKPSEESERVLIYYPHINTARMWQSLQFWHEYKKPLWAFVFPDIRGSSIVSMSLEKIIKKTIKDYFPGLSFFKMQENDRPRIRPFIMKGQKKLLKRGLKAKPIPKDAQPLSFHEGVVNYLAADWRLPNDFLKLPFMNLSGGMRRQFINSVAFLASALEDVLFIGDCPDLYLDAFKSDIFLAWIEKMALENHTFILVLTSPYMKEQIKLLQAPMQEYFMAEGRIASA
ncbi:MAG: ATP-binding cassette domain-containing protein [Candidatus Hodarchaeales archaeon]|jgi:ABC-type multidrug transport system ATPase subunit